MIRGPPRSKRTDTLLPERRSADLMAGVFTTTLTQAEIFYGLALLPEGRRRDDLLAAARPMFDVDLAGRVLPFDTDAASAYPEIAAGRKRSEERRVGKECVSTCRSRWSQYH